MNDLAGSNQLSRHDGANGLNGQNGLRRDAQHRSNEKIPTLQYHFKKVSLEIGTKRILSDLSLEVKNGEFIFITGVAGAGKTSLLNVLSREYKVQGEMVQLPVQDMFISRLHQDVRLIEELTALDNLLLFVDKKIYKSMKNYMIELEQLAKYLGLHEFFNTPVKNLNGGSKQKVALLRALMSRPNILLLDEPTSALDIDNAQKVFELVRYFNEKFHMTIFWASHNRDMVRKFTGKNIHLEKGRIVYTGHACLI